MNINKLQKNNPTGWREVKISDVADISAGGTPSTTVSDYWEHGNISWAKSGEINKRYIYKTENFITELGLEESSAKIVPKNSVLIALAGQGSTRGKVAINKIPLATNQSIAFFVSNSKLDYRFLFLDLDRRYAELRSISAGDGGRGGLNLSLLKSLKIKLPNISEQQRIVAVLETWDQAIEKLEKKIKFKKNIKKGLMQNLLTGKVRLAGFSDEWKTIKLNDIGKTYTGLTGKDKNDFGSGKPFITYMNIYSSSRINLDNCEFVKINNGESQNKSKYGDIFFTTSSETPHEVGMAAVLLNKNAKDLYLNSFCFGFRLNDFKILSPEFSEFLFRGQEFRKQMTRIAQGASRYNLSKKYFLETKIKIPSDMKEQNAVADIIKISDKEIEALEKKLVFLKGQKKYLLNNLITGAIRTSEKQSTKK